MDAGRLADEAGLDDLWVWDHPAPHVRRSRHPGVGRGWFADEHSAYGIEYGESTAQRLDRLDEAAAVVRSLLDGETTTARGPHYSTRDLVNDPPPVLARLPLLIGGSGARKTLATVARYADVWNTGGARRHLAPPPTAVARLSRNVMHPSTIVTRGAHPCSAAGVPRRSRAATRLMECGC
jgi:alkanesulfonate monooxygenase SsuD/methylene tetrahydromethanopterin reductase-like flavin-dependent oxidoreductase (luciferase family)